MAKIKDTQEKFEICKHGNCSTCLSYPKESKEGLYCARGPSKSSIEKKVVIALKVLSGLTMGYRACITVPDRIRAEFCLVSF
jgi:hypothetical protein